MDETTGTARALRAVVATTLVTCLVAALTALVGSTSASAASATVTGSTSVGARTLSSCKQTAVSSCRKVTARKCRVTKAKKIRARGDKVNRRKVAKTCARVAKRHCKKAAQKRKQAAAAKRCVGRGSSPVRRGAIRGAAASTGVLPSAASTGVPVGTRLKVVRGDLTITKAGTVLDGLDIRGWVTIKADNVTISNSIVRGRTGGGTLVANINGAGGLVIKNSTLAATHEHVNLAGVKGRNFSLDRVEIADVVDSMQIIGGNASVTNSWMHSNVHLADSRYADGVSHDDNIQIEGGANTVIQNNRIEGSHNAAIMVTQNYARINGLSIVDNFLQHGACTINADEKGKGTMENVDISANSFGPSMKYGKTCPLWVPKASAVSMAKNLWADNGASINVRYR